MDLYNLDNIGLPDVKALSDRLSYVPAERTPLSSDIGIIKGDRRIYLYDVGSTLGDLKFLHSLPDTKSIIISHFHGDHTWWLSDHKHGEHGVADDDNISTAYDRPRYHALYVSPVSAKYVVPQDIYTSESDSSGPDSDHAHVPGITDPSRGYGSHVLVREAMDIADGVRLRIVPLPCTHCKGSLALLVDDDFALLGDATYPNKVNGVTFYNAQLLKSEIELLETFIADCFCLSHDTKFVRPKKVVLRQLKSVYDSWDRVDSLIRL